MYHCPECSTELKPAEGATRSDEARGGPFLDTLYYNCPGCGQHFLFRKKEYADREPSAEWYHVAAGGKTLLMHQPPEY